MHSPISGPPFSAVEATHSTHNHHRGGRHNHLPTRIMPACADLELCKAPDNPPLGERDGHGCRAGCGGRLHGMCGEQEEGESEMHRICNPCLDKKQKGSGGSSNQPKRRSPASAFLQQGCLLYTSPSPRDLSTSRMPSSA